MRGLIEKLATPHPFIERLPAIYRAPDPSDEKKETLSMRLAEALDELIAPIICTLDCISSYFDPQECPDDFVPWLANWVGMALDQNWPPERQRAAIAQAGELYKWRGTVRGLKKLVALYTGIEPEIEESGGVVWSATPGSETGESASPKLVVRLHLSAGSNVDLKRVDAIVRAAKPAHVPHSVVP